MERRNPAKDAAILAEIQRMDWEGGCVPTTPSNSLGRENDVPGDDRKDPRAPRVKGRTSVPGIDFTIKPFADTAVINTNGHAFDSLDAVNAAKMEGGE